MASPVLNEILSLTLTYLCSIGDIHKDVGPPLCCIDPSLFFISRYWSAEADVLLFFCDY